MLVKELIELLQSMIVNEDNAEVMIIDEKGNYLNIVDVESEDSELITIGVEK